MFGMNIPCLYRLIYLCLLIIIFPITVNAENSEISLSAGAEREILNYEGESENRVIRAGASLKLGESFLFSYTELRDISDDAYTSTWFLGLMDIGSFMNFTAGYYYLHFGSGLMMGKKTYTSSDPFNRKFSVSRDELLTGAGGGNPAYPFYGAAAELYTTTGDVKISILPFFSVQKRFITDDSYEDRAIDSSLFTLSSRIQKKDIYTEPVNIINYGAAFEMKTPDLITFQCYCFDTDLRDSAGNNILWDKNKFCYGGGVDLIRNLGFFAEYRDDNISLFVEPAMSIVYCGANLTGHAVTWGTSMRNSCMHFSLRGKNTDMNFHSEYSSGSRTPERILELRYSIFPFRCLETGCIVYSEKNLVPAYNRDYLEGSVQEEIFSALDTGCMRISLDMKRKEHYSTDRTDPLDRGNLSAGFTLTERLFLKLKASVQKFEDEESGLAGCEMKFMFMDYFSLSAGYAEIKVKGDTPFYAVISPGSEHSPAECFRKPARGASVKLRYRKEKDSFYARLGVKKTASVTEVQAESAVVLVF